MPLASARALPQPSALRLGSSVALSPGLILALSAGALLLTAAAHMALPPLSRHMAVHIVLMNVIGPLAVWVLARLRPALLALRWHLGWAAVAQMAALWTWHIPAALAGAHASLGAGLTMQASLFASALWFWMAVAAALHGRPWQAIAALLGTGKVFCLLGALLTFSPRYLYPPHLAAGFHDAASSLSDQQLAGLFMLAACPAAYVLAGIVIAARWLHEMTAGEP
jgi:putative membrane protein